jgi:peptide/nickel transport system substrate-binding protein
LIFKEEFMSEILKIDLGTRSLSRRRFMGTSAGGFAAAMLAGGVLPAGVGRAVAAQDGGTEFHSAWPYLDFGAGGHLNHFVTNGIMNPPNIYGDLMFVPMGMLYWASSEWLPLVAEEWAFLNTGHVNAPATPGAMASPVAVVEANASPSSLTAGATPAPADAIADADTLQVKLRQGVNWSDGTPVTAQDVIDTHDILKLQGNTVWDYLASIEALDDYTLNFYMSLPSTVVERYVIRRSPMPSSVYGEWAQRARDLFDAGVTDEDAEWKQLVEQFNEFRPETLVVNGPYTIDVESVTNAQFDMPKNPDSYWADQAKFDKIVNFNGETDTISAVVLSQDIDYATHGFAPATEQSMTEQGIRVLRPPTYSGASLKFNYSQLTHFSDKRVRQALAHAIDREQVGFVSLAESGVPVEFMTGMSDNLVPEWLDQEAIDSLHRYEYDPERAAALLEEAGWTKDGEWWTDPDGNEAAYELSFPAEFADYSATGTNVAEQLTAFGFNIAPRAVTFTQIPTDVLEGRFQMVIQAWGSSTNPHPHYSYVQDFFFQNTRVETETARGMDFPLVQETDVAGEVDIEELVVASGEGMDIERQKEQIEQIALVFNELLNIIPLYERYGNNAALEGVRVAEWPEDDDPILENSPYADGIPTMLMLTGELEPVQ